MKHMLAYAPMIYWYSKCIEDKFSRKSRIDQFFFPSFTQFQAA